MDHAFTVLQGKARFHGLRGEVWDIGRHEGILVPSGAYYCMENSGDDVLVLLCSASLARHKGDPDIRLSVQGKHINSHSPKIFAARITLKAKTISNSAANWLRS